jgi:hypothetical protein
MSCRGCSESELQLAKQANELDGDSSRLISTVVIVIDGFETRKFRVEGYEFEDTDADKAWSFRSDDYIDIGEAEGLLGCGRVWKKVKLPAGISGGDERCGRAPLSVCTKTPHEIIPLVLFSTTVLDPFKVDADTFAAKQMRTLQSSLNTLPKTVDDFF